MTQFELPPSDAIPNSAGGLEEYVLHAVFDEPWQAEVVATTVHLSQKGVFTWKEWVSVFSREIQLNPQRTAETVNDAYYRQWLAALESILCKLEIIDAQEIGITEEHWRRSYLHTRHGSPVEFRRDHPPVTVWPHHHEHSHDLDEQRSPQPFHVSTAAKR